MLEPPEKWLVDMNPNQIQIPLAFGWIFPMVVAFHLGSSNMRLGALACPGALYYALGLQDIRFGFDPWALGERRNSV